MNKNVLRMINSGMLEPKDLVDKADLEASEVLAELEGLKILAIFLKVCLEADLEALVEERADVIQMLHNAEMTYNNRLRFLLKKQPLVQQKKFQ